MLNQNLKVGAYRLYFGQDMEDFVFSTLATGNCSIDKSYNYCAREIVLQGFNQVRLLTVCGKFDADGWKIVGVVPKSRFFIFWVVAKKLSRRKWAWPM